MAKGNTNNQLQKLQSVVDQSNQVAAIDPWGYDASTNTQGAGDAPLQGAGNLLGESVAVPGKIDEKKFQALKKQLAQQKKTRPLDTAEQMILGAKTSKDLLKGNTRALGPVRPETVTYLFNYLGQKGVATGEGQTGKTLSANQATSEFLQLYKKNPTKYAQLQNELYQSGFYGNTIPTPGKPPSPQDISAFEAATTVAIQTKTPIDTYLQQSAANSKQTGTPSGPISVQLTNAQDLSTLVTTAFQDSLGRDPSPDEKAKFVASYQSQQAQAQKAQAISGQMAQQSAPTDIFSGGTGSPSQVFTNTSAPSADVAATAFAKQTDPESAYATDWAQRAGTVLKALTQPSGGPSYVKVNQ